MSRSCCNNGNSARNWSGRNRASPAITRASTYRDDGTVLGVNPGEFLGIRNMNSETSARVHAAEQALSDLIRAAEAFHAAGVGPLVRASEAIIASIEAGGKVLIFGNGGSAAEAQHWAAELTGRFLRERRALPAIALTVDTSALTAIGNDYGFDRIFERQVEALGAPGDVAIGISTSGKSANVIRAMESASKAGLTTIALAGTQQRPELACCNHCISFPAEATPRIQELHLLAIHVVCDLVEAHFAGVEADDRDTNGSMPLCNAA
ncbi:D-sedoheptulose 7-phosphate isomerase [Stratiformator vulcanicus]|uniref:Phosphoheptose isomerase n=1 Tax=Stratiformator vulcanicus TaxID=2527980 RepID=A0A517R5W9_9PLAN|nr:D-sedoheptulose 7-phosphate isomerase [Stratiformator vulcanicus]QDT39235.1 Phosphoheptose isomerase 1 [Stratiformator vulcanicus]